MLVPFTCALVSLLCALASVPVPLIIDSGTQYYLDVPSKALRALDLSLEEYSRHAVELYTGWFDKGLRDRTELLRLIRCTRAAQHDAMLCLAPVLIFLRGRHLSDDFTISQLPNGLAWPEALYSSTLNAIRGRITAELEFLLDCPQKIRKGILNSIFCRETGQGDLNVSLVTSSALEVIRQFSKFYCSTLAFSTALLEAKRVREQEQIPLPLVKKRLASISLPRLAAAYRAWRQDHLGFIQAWSHAASAGLEALLPVRSVAEDLLPLVTEDITWEELVSIIDFAKGPGFVGEEWFGELTKTDYEAARQLNGVFPSGARQTGYSLPAIDRGGSLPQVDGEEPDRFCGAPPVLVAILSSLKQAMSKILCVTGARAWWSPLEPLRSETCLDSLFEVDLDTLDMAFDRLYRYLYITAVSLPIPQANGQYPEALYLQEAERFVHGMHVHLRGAVSMLAQLPDAGEPRGSAKTTLNEYLTKCQRIADKWVDFASIELPLESPAPRHFQVGPTNDSTMPKVPLIMNGTPLLAKRIVPKSLPAPPVKKTFPPRD